MSARRILRILRTGLAGLAAVLLVVALAILAHGEWRMWRAHASPPVVPDAPAPPGSATAPVLILLHGAGLNGHMWDAVRRHLDPAYRVIAPDLPGHGTRLDEVFTEEAATTTVAATARSVAPAPVVLVGDSLGGYVAIAAAAAVPPEQLRGLVIGGCTAELGHAAMLRYLRDASLIGIASVFVDPKKFTLKVLDMLGVAPADARAIVGGGVSLRAVPADVRALLYGNFRDRLAAIDRPVLIINGTLDAGSIAGEPAFLAAARHGTSHPFENTGHGVSMRKSAEYAALVNDFAARAFAATDSPPRPTEAPGTP